MSTEPSPLEVREAADIEAISEQVFERVKKEIAERLEKIQAATEKAAGEMHLKADALITREEFSGLTAKLEDFKNEVVRIAGQLEEVSKRLNLAFEEIRSVGGKALERVPTEPAKKAGRALTLLEFGED